MSKYDSSSCKVMREVKLMARRDKSRTCVRDVVKIENFTNSHT